MNEVLTPRHAECNKRVSLRFRETASCLTETRLAKKTQASRSRAKCVLPTRSV